MPTLIVPIDLEALPIGSVDITNGADTQVPTADFSTLPYQGASGPMNVTNPYYSPTVLAEATPFGGATAFVSGIHLHWALPDGLTHGMQAENTSGQADFPCVPNRWLVTRVVLDSTTTTAPVVEPKSWVIESDRLLQSPDIALPAGFNQPTIPLDPQTVTASNDNLPNFRYIGQLFDAATWQEDNDPTVERFTPLLATGYGEPTFASYYPNCNTVFGMVDTFSDITFNPATMTVSYQVIGWYSATGNDPLQSLQIQSGNNRFHWKFDGGVPPTNTMCVGFADNIPWNANGNFLTDQQNSITAAIANSAPEALSALLASLPELNTINNAEQLLNALQLGYLNKSGSLPDALTKFDEALHSIGFSSFSGGSLWQLKTTDGSAMPVLEPDVYDVVAQINLRQENLISKQEKLTIASTQLFADWSKYLVVNYQNSSSGPMVGQQQNALDYLMNTDIPAIQSLANEVKKLYTEITNAAEELNTILPQNVQLYQSQPKEVYRQPHDPVLALYGADVVPPVRYGGDGQQNQDGLLYCRLDSELNTSLALPANFVNTSSAVTLDASQLPLPTLFSEATPTLIPTLIQESYLLAPSLQPAIANYINSLGTGNPASIDFSQTIINLQSTLTAFMTTPLATSTFYNGVSPEQLQINNWSLPWLPLLLQYKVNFYPVQWIDTTGTTQDTYDPQFVLNNFQWDTNAIELQYTGANPPNFTTYEGTITLTSNGTAALQGAIKSYLPHTSGQTQQNLESLLTDVKSMQQLSQGLSGTVQAMVMQQQILQLPVWDPVAIPFVLDFDLPEIVDAAGNETGIASDPMLIFNPIRTGMLNVESLQLVDVFGRTRIYNSDSAWLNLVVSSGLQNTSTQAPLADQLFLPPRLIQPSRIGFDWLSPDCSGPANTEDPTLFGWVITDDLENGLFVYTSQGQAVGEFIVPLNSQTLNWLPAPGGAAVPGSSLTNSIAALTPGTANTALADFLNQVNDGGATFFCTFLQSVLDAQATIAPPSAASHSETPLLFGQPLALARASIRIEVQGGDPVCDQSWTSFYNLSVNSGQPYTASFENVQFPLRLGDLSQINDGLVGFWITQSQATDYQKFYCFAAETAENGVLIPAFDTLTMQPAGPSIQVTLLFDPRAPVHLTTGIFPVKNVGIPQQQFANALSSLSMSFLTAPVLSGSNTGNISIPLPNENAGTWLWYSAGDNGNWNNISVTSDANAQSGLNYTPQQIVDGWMQFTPVNTSTQQPEPTS